MRRGTAVAAGAITAMQPTESPLETSTMTSHLSRFLKDDSGATAIEYGLIAALISVAIIAATTTLGSNISNTFKNVADNIAK
jgi:pilus assembly protein Flp/PilA